MEGGAGIFLVSANIQLRTGGENKVLWGFTGGTYDFASARTGWNVAWWKISHGARRLDAHYSPNQQFSGALIGKLFSCYYRAVLRYFRV
jgi:hypothetical protein